MKNWKMWLYGLVSAFIGGSATAIVLIVADPTTYNFQSGIWKVFQVALVSGCFAAAGYLKKSPLPDLEYKQEVTVTTEVTAKTASQAGPLILLIAVLPLFFLTGCATGPVTGEQVTSTVEKAVPYIRPAAALVCSSVLNLAVSDSDRVEKANYIYAVAKAVNSLAGGQVPTKDQLESTIKLWAPDKAHWASLANSIASVYGGVYSQVKGNPKLALEVLEAIAAGCEDAAGVVTQ